jgi:hypothetical protein
MERELEAEDGMEAQENEEEIETMQRETYDLE